VNLRLSAGVPLFTSVCAFMAWNGTKPHPYLLAYNLWGHRNIGSDNLAGGQLDRELQGLTTLDGKESEAASAV
jgi:hypothetical protein